MRQQKDQDLQVENLDWSIVENLDHNDCLLLYEIYKEGSYALPLLVDRVKEKLSIKYGAVRHRLEVLAGANLIEKVEDTRPKIYMSYDKRENFIKELLKTKFAKLGLEKINKL